MIAMRGLPSQPAYRHRRVLPMLSKRKTQVLAGEAMPHTLRSCQSDLQRNADFGPLELPHRTAMCKMGCSLLQCRCSWLAGRWIHLCSVPNCESRDAVCRLLAVTGRRLCMRRLRWVTGAWSKASWPWERTRMRATRCVHGSVMSVPCLCHTFVMCSHGCSGMRAHILDCAASCD